MREVQETESDINSVKTGTVENEFCRLGGYPACFIETHVAMPKDFTCGCGLYVHPSRMNPSAIHIEGCKYVPKQ